MEEADFVSGRTRLFGIVGDPIEQVRSPEIFSAAFRRRGRDAILVPIHVRPDDFDACLPSLLQVQNLDGLVFTIPYKARACRLAATLGAQARVVGAINALGRDSAGSWRGEIFDGLGCVEAFRRRGITFADRRVLLIGAGGAGSAIGVAVAAERPRAIRLFDLDQARADALAQRIAKVDPRIEVALALPAIEDADILLNATPVGMLSDSGIPVAARHLPERLVVFDAVVKPERTGLLALAESCGCTTVFGREMMAGQIERMVAFFLDPPDGINAA
jgi:shikimate dehydrogenase